MKRKFKKEKSESKESYLVSWMGFLQVAKYPTKDMEEHKVGRARIYFDKDPTNTQVICVKVGEPSEEEEQTFLRYAFSKDIPRERKRVIALYS